MNIIEIKKTGITDTDCEAIVCPANNYLLAAGGVCGEVFKAAGREELLEACRELKYCETGKAVITPGFGLKQKYIIHAVGPIWQNEKYGEEDALRGAYRNSLRLAAEKELKSVAFPLLSAGIYGCPVTLAWKIAFESVMDFFRGNNTDGMHVVFAVFDDNYIISGRREIAIVQKNYEKEYRSGEPEIEFRGFDAEVESSAREDKFVFFWNEGEANGFMSQWYKAPFDIDGVKYSCTEQYLMAKKALAMGDLEYYVLIMHESDPGKMQNLGKKIRGFESAKWLRISPSILYDATFAKFDQNMDLKRMLLETEDRILVYASPYDLKYGTGWGPFEPEVRRMDFWPGKNLLGKTLMKVRETLKADAGQA